MPSERLVVPSERLVMPSEPFVMPSERLVVPSECLVMPSEHLVMPSEHLVMPSEPFVMPSERLVMLSELFVMLSEPFVMPSNPSVMIFYYILGQLSSKTAQLRAFFWYWHSFWLWRAHFFYQQIGLQGYFLGEPLRRASHSSRRAIRSITIAGRSAPLWWFRYYPSRFAPFGRKYEV